MSKNRKLLPPGPVERLGRRAADLAERLVPDPFAIAIILTFAALAGGAIHAGPAVAIRAWAGGFFDLLKFGMQMCLVLATGHALAVSPPFRRLLNALADRPRSARQAVALVAVVSILFGLINWGLGLIFGALLARETATRATARGIPVHYPLIAAAGYLGLAVWHGGLSGSAPLDVATPGHRLADSIGVIPVAQTLYTAPNLAIAATLLLVLPLTLVLLTPRRPAATDAVRVPAPTAPDPRHETAAAGDAAERDPPPGDDAEAPPPRADDTLIRAIERGPWLNRGIGLVGAAAIAIAAGRGTFSLTLDTICFLFLFLGLLLHRSPSAYARAIADSGRGLTGIVLQFPFYAGILGVLKGTGLLAATAVWFADVASPSTFPLLVFVSAGIINLFVPSGGGQWAVQGPIIVEAAGRIGVPVEDAVMALAYGDQLTNLLQPFWALPLLAITGVRARDIMGYTALVMIVAGAVFAVALVVL